ncbi:MAG: Adenosine deaminase [Methanoregula sp. SKADARSKE-2]|nr:MAG: Adenosine deaminase [Methanoregula sp. SKADARSKE-2]
MKKLELVSGLVLTGEDFEILPSDIVVEDGIIRAIEANPQAPRTWICPAFFNAHTHLGDTVAMDCAADGPLTDLVTPPDGLKHRLLAEATQNELVSGMRASIEGMLARGISGCADFREGGPAGVAALREAAEGLPFRPVIFGREGGELYGEGIGISSTRDVADLDQLIENARKNGRLVAFHAGERDLEDIDSALQYDPDIIIHATHATREQLRECVDRNIPIAICPRSNWRLGVAGSVHHPPLKLMQELGCTLFLGTDNVMFVSPDIFSEMAFCHTIYKTGPEDLLRAAIGGSVLMGDDPYIRIGARANFFTLDPGSSALRFSRNPLRSLIQRGEGVSVGKNVFNA